MDGWNYFNYFTEIEEYFWKKRGAHLLVSPLDWAIMEAWQKTPQRYSRPCDSMRRWIFLRATATWKTLMRSIGPCSMSRLASMAIVNTGTVAWTIRGTSGA